MSMAQPAEKQTWTIEAVLKWAADDFRARGIESPRLDAEVLLAHALATTRVQLFVDGKRPLTADELSRFREMVKRRRSREPTAYILGWREFYGRPYKVDARVLVPRPDTETLVGVALERTRACSMSTRVLDLCTGSGCVAITLGRERPTSSVTAVDVSEGALAVARENAMRLGAYNVALRKGDLYEGLAGRAFDLVTANPPYIPSSDLAGLAPDVREHEPRLALDGGADGLDVLRRVVAGAPAVLAPGGVLAVEIEYREAEPVRALFAEHGFEDVETAKDYARLDRVVSGRTRGTAPR
jgi:release factor glutamine methyltransferase